MGLGGTPTTKKKKQDHSGMDWDSSCEPINLSLFRLTEKLGAGCRCRQASQNNPYRPSMGIPLGIDAEETTGKKEEHQTQRCIHISGVFNKWYPLPLDGNLTD
jgi:hypothetical protein